MQEVKKVKDTYVVIVTRGHKDDAAALKPCIGSDLAYIGMIGSRNKITTMRMNFIEKGWASVEQWAKIYAPVGLDIKSQTVEEIAVSIAAQLVLIRNSRKQRVGSR
jgi:xanthine dehydrogenase accessory factor